MPRAKSRCGSDPMCKHYKPCPVHKVWKPSSGTRPLPGNWKSLKKKARGYAEKRCYVCNRVRPNGAVDHVIPRSQGGPDLPPNLAWICDVCHAGKTELEKQAGRKKLKE